MYQNIIKIEPLPFNITTDSFIQKFKNHFQIKKAQIIDNVGYIQIADFNESTPELLAFTFQDRDGNIYISDWGSQLHLPTSERTWAKIIGKQQNQSKQLTQQKNVTGEVVKQEQKIEKIIKISPLPYYVTKIDLQNLFSSHYKIKKVQIVDQIGYVQFTQFSQEERKSLSLEYGDQLKIQTYGAFIELPTSSRTWVSINQNPKLITQIVGSQYQLEKKINDQILESYCQQFEQDEKMLSAFNQSSKNDNNQKQQMISSQVKKFDYDLCFNREKQIQKTSIEVNPKNLQKTLNQKLNTQENNIQINAQTQTNKQFFNFPDQVLFMIIIGFLVYMLI